MLEVITSNHCTMSGNSSGKAKRDIVILIHAYIVMYMSMTLWGFGFVLLFKSISDTYIYLENSSFRFCTE